MSLLEQKFYENANLCLRFVFSRRPSLLFRREFSRWRASSQDTVTELSAGKQGGVGNITGDPIIGKVSINESVKSADIKYREKKTKKRISLLFRR
jgi:hypothetical protein